MYTILNSWTSLIHYTVILINAMQPITKPGFKLPIIIYKLIINEGQKSKF